MLYIDVRLSSSLCRTNQVDSALELFTKFTSLYPPADIKDPTSFSRALPSSRVLLLGAKPLVRLTTNSQIPDGSIPPSLSFEDVEALHHRLVGAGRKKDVGRVHYWCMAYEGAGRRRREHALGVKPMSTVGRGEKAALFGRGTEMKRIGTANRDV